jgi:O-antigen ligase
MPQPTSSPPSPFPRRAALGVLQLGALAVVLVAVPFKLFELDRFFVPKEVALHATALLAGLLCTWRVRRFTFDRVDTLLVAYAGLSALSTIFSRNHVASTRALAITLSGIAIFWSARAVAASGYRRGLVIAIVVSIVVGASTGLLQAYGLRTEYASLSRAPGGTFGNRNFMAHLCAIGLPLLVWCVVTARRGIGVVTGVIATAMLAAALVLSRTRAAWVALGMYLVLLAIPTWLTLRAMARTTEPMAAENAQRAARRFALVALSAAVGGLAALALPNHLNWKSDSPYLDSVRGVVDYSSGSGKGRLIQYKNSLRMAAAHPILGVGPGNWPVHYSKFATRRDPSLSRETGRPSNPWPSSDWVAMVSERGVVATLVFLVAYLGMIIAGWRRSEDPLGLKTPPENRLASLAATGMLIVAAIAGAFDAVLLLAAPTLLVFAAAGALSTAGAPRATWEPSDGTRRLWLLAAGVVGILMVARSAASISAMATRCTSYRITLERCR